MQGLNDTKIAIIGLGYVGLPLAIEFSKKFPTVGFDINKNRVNELNNGTDSTLEVDNKSLESAINKGLVLSSNIESISTSNTYIVTVPTPIDDNKAPNLKPLEKASSMLSSILKKGDVVIYESTTYPGCTEEFCVPILESLNQLKYNEDFFCGYSPERINPGDKKNTLTKIVKVTSGSNPEAARFVDHLYKSIIEAGTHMTASMAVAEAAKAIENAQRDVNISFVNELSLIFDRMNIDTREVLDAAATKCNFLNYTPGLVGGHCIGVDPYYLAHKAQTVGYKPQVILSGRRVNDAMGLHVASTLMKLLILKNIPIKKSKVLILGITFKENCPDIRNTKIIDVLNELRQHEIDVDVFDPNANPIEVKKVLGINLLDNINNLKNYDGIILAVAHTEFMSLDLKSSKNQVIYDLKGIYPKQNVDKRL